MPRELFPIAPIAAIHALHAQSLGLLFPVEFIHVLSGLKRDSTTAAIVVHPSTRHHGPVPFENSSPWEKER